ncbi:hypothetical protein BJY00DRAFT_192673 [Aspergillus carlsbadensis]|nr:hypothetical protein BJY00DRAFT_192673 [Aspergillus carlsbadensis]
MAVPLDNAACLPCCCHGERSRNTIQSIVIRQPPLFRLLGVGVRSPVLVVTRCAICHVCCHVPVCCLVIAYIIAPLFATGISLVSLRVLNSENLLTGRTSTQTKPSQLPGNPVSPTESGVKVWYLGGRGSSREVSILGPNKVQCSRQAAH